MSSSPAVVHKSKFVLGNSKVFKSYINYIDRDEATRNYKFNEFSLYNDYMENPEKSGSIFTSDKDYLTNQEKLNLKDKFELAQQNRSLMWQDVFSFDNDWLVENGYYDKETHILDEAKLRGAVRRCMNNHLEKANMDTALWSASFHYNTKHIHVHIATVELTNNPKEKGKRTKSELSKMKSNFINELRHREEEYKKINEIMRENIVGNREKFLSSDDKVLKEKMMELLKKLPSNKKYWYYGYNKINSVKPLLNAISKYYIEKYHKEDYKELMTKLTIEELELKRIYGEGKEGKEKGRYKDYKKNKEEELYKKMGNSILKELREYVKEEEGIVKNKNYVTRNIEKENLKDDFKFSDKKNVSEKTERVEYRKCALNTIEIKQEDNKENFNKTFKEKNNTYRKREKNCDDILNKFSEEKLFKDIKVQSRNIGEYNNKFSISINVGLMNRLKKAMRNDFEKYINQREYEKSERQKEYENERESELEK